MALRQWDRHQLHVMGLAPSSGRYKRGGMHNPVLFHHGRTQHGRVVSGTVPAPGEVWGVMPMP